MTYIIQSQSNTSQPRNEFIFNSQLVEVSDLFDLVTYNSNSVLFNYNNSKFDFFSYDNAYTSSNCSILKNDLGFNFDPASIDAGFYHVSLSICFLRINTASGDNQIVVNVDEVDNRYSLFAGTETGDLESVAHCRFLFHGNSNKKTPSTSFGNIDYFKFNKHITTSVEREYDNRYFKSFTQLNLDYTFESNSSDNYLPTFYFYLKDQNGNSINTEKLSIYNTSFKLTKFNSSNPEVVDLFS